MGWESVKATDVVVGDVINVRDVELHVARIEPTFLGRSEMMAFIEDRPERWLKVPVPNDATVEVQRG
jgi:hypothetical protein